MVKETEKKSPIAQRNPKPQKHKVYPTASERNNKYWWVNPRNWTSGMVWSVVGLVALGYLFFFYYFFIGPSSFIWRRQYGSIKYPDGYEVHGIDVSHYQGRIDWEKVRNATINEEPIRFVFIKATEGKDLMDEYYYHNFREAKENGFLRGAYHFFSTQTSGKEQAEYFIRQVRLENGDLPPVLDIESIGGLSKEELKHEVLEWMRIVEAHYKVKPILYTYQKFKVKYLNDEIFDQYPFWLAHYYVEKAQHKGKWMFWQHSDLGEIDGIKEKVDLNIFNGSLYQLIKFTIGATPIEEINY